MRLIRTSVAFLAAVLAGALPSIAAEPAPTVSTETSPALSAPAQPAQLPWLTPEPLDMAGQKAGPCTVSVPCRFGPVISCSGANVCYWQYDSKYIRGYVSCDGGTWYCPTTPSPD